jgi:microcompartment protein CcmK/EutM
VLLGRVIGTVVPAVITDGLAGTSLLWVQPLDAALSLDPWFVPVDHAIIGLVDEIKNDPPRLDSGFP